VSIAAQPLTSDELEARLRQIGAERYHHLHRFHRRLHTGQCTYEEVQAWALNRYYYQAMIPIKDATILAKIPDPEDRRQWRKRIEDHDGLREGDGGIERWLKLTDSLGFPRDYVISTHGICPAPVSPSRLIRNSAAAGAFCRRSLLPSRNCFRQRSSAERVAGMLAHYDFVNKETLAYFSQRPVQAKRDSDFALDYVKKHAATRAEQNSVIAALEFKPPCFGRSSTRSGVLMSMAPSRPEPGCREP